MPTSAQKTRDDVLTEGGYSFADMLSSFSQLEMLALSLSFFSTAMFCENDEIINEVGADKGYMCFIKDTPELNLVEAENNFTIALFKLVHSYKKATEYIKNVARERGYYVKD